MPSTVNESDNTTQTGSPSPCATIVLGAPSALHRFYREHEPLVHLQPLDSSRQKPNFIIPRFRDGERSHPLCGTLFSAEAEPGTTNLDSVLDAERLQGKRMPTSPSTHSGRTGMSDTRRVASSVNNMETVLDCALYSLNDNTAL